MKSGTIPLAIFVALCILVGVVWIGRGSPVVVKDHPKPPEEDPKPRINTTGPQPKAVIDKPEYDFGVMLVGEEGKHTFVIRNEGEAALVLKKGTTTCKCTVSKLPTAKIPVGESVEIEITWTPTALSDVFEQRVTIFTNDPKNDEITLTIKGRVQEAVILVPADGWNVGDIHDDEPTEVTGLLHSGVKKEFKVLGITSTHKLLTAEAIPLGEKELKRLGAKSGYEIKATLAPGIEPGRFNERLTIKTDVGDGDGASFGVAMRGRRLGPIRILPLGRVRWYEQQNVLDMGRFPSADGCKATLQLFVSGLGEKELEFDIQKSVKFLKIGLTRDTKLDTGDRKRYLLTFEVPPGSPTASFQRNSPIKITVTTNHPEMKTIEFRVLFICR